MNIIESAISLAQKHLERITPEETEMTLKIGEEQEEEGLESDAAAIRAHIAKKQRTLAVLECKQGSSGL
eukprot:3811081-Rhodomonas_salina.1